MKTRVIEIDEHQLPTDQINQAADLLCQGKLVAFPTETVYGIGANALSALASKHIYEAKGRPSDNPLIVHLASWEQLPEYVTGISEQAEKLAKVFWPGPLTMIFHKKPNISSEITGGLDTVGIRIPSHPVAHAILETCNLPIAAPSANISGKPSPTEFRHVLADLDGRVDAIVSSGSSQVGLESTVVDMTQKIPIILRPGGISKEMIENVIGKVKMNHGILSDQEIPVAPGMKYRHYAPIGRVHLLPKADFDKTLETLQLEIAKLEKKSKKIAILGPIQYIQQMPEYLSFNLGDENNLEEIAHHLFDGLRFMDLHGVDEIFAISYEEKGIGEAIMNRLRKAAGEKSEK